LEEKTKLIVATCVIALVTVTLVIAGVTVFAPKPTLTLLTTTSMQDSGLLDLIKPAFEAKYGVDFRWIAAGTGQAIAAAAQGDGDVVIAHSLTYEREFINHTSTKYSYSGNGIFRVTFAYNYFVIVGPTADPANVTGMPKVDNGTLIFKRIYDAAESGKPVIFTSRGDKSGTNTKEETIWKAWGLNGTVQTKTWYKSLGQGMGPTLTTTNEMQAYTLTDYGTWLKMRHDLTNLKVLSALQCKDLKNTYSIMAVDPQKHPNVNFGLAEDLIYFMVREGQNIIGNYTIDGEQVFFKYVKPDCWCGSPLCPITNGTFHPVCPSDSPTFDDDCLSCGACNGLNSIQPAMSSGGLSLMLPTDCGRDSLIS
jgi:tungstate transport system substrate-binding protein